MTCFWQAHRNRNLIHGPLGTKTCTSHRTNPLKPSLPASGGLSVLTSPCRNSTAPGNDKVVNVWDRPHCAVKKTVFSPLSKNFASFIISARSVTFTIVEKVSLAGVLLSAWPQTSRVGPFEFRGPSSHTSDQQLGLFTNTTSKFINLHANFIGKLVGCILSASLCINTDNIFSSRWPDKGPSIVIALN